MDTGKAHKRIQSLDVARGLAVFFMIAVHTLEVFGSKELKQSATGGLIEFLGGPPAAPVFMTLMGLSMVLAGKNDPKRQLKRGLIFFLSGYALNLIRAVLPLQLMLYFNGEYAQTFPLDAIGVLTIVDILQFAGLAMMITAVNMPLKLPAYMDLLFALLIIIVSPFLWGMSTETPVVKYVFELLWGDIPFVHPFITNKIAFPLFPWLAFPYLGLYLGKIVHAAQDQDKVFRNIGWGGLIAACIGIGISATDFDYHFNDYYHSRQGAMIFMCGFVAAWVSLIHWITNRIPWNGFFQLLTVWSKGVTNIYFLQWVMILWTFFIWRKELDNVPALLLLIALFTGLAHFINQSLQQKKDNTRKRGNTQTFTL